MRLATLAFLPFVLAAQPKFEVVSIRTVPPNTPPTMREIGFTPLLPGGQYVDSRTGLWSMLAFAYEVKDPANRLLGLPGWAKETSYSVAAKPPEGSSPSLAQVRLMMQAMLAERFHLQIHHETREEAVYRVEVARGGLKIPEVAAPVPPEKEGFPGVAMGDSGGRLIGKKVTIGFLIRALAPHIKKPMVDATGLTGYYDFDVKWTAPEAPDGHIPASSFGPDGAALLMSVLQERFGLKLVKSTGPVEYWVVDHVEPPTEN
jgi:uncharacterized protein (TIGR03435 family)